MSDTSPSPLITPDEFHQQTTERHWFGSWLGGRITAVGWGTATMELQVRDELLREGGTVAGPIIMGAADVALYAAVMSAYTEGRGAVTADMTMHFLRRPEGQVLKAEARIIKFGKRLAMGRIEIFMDDDDRAAAHIVSSYAIP